MNTEVHQVSLSFDGDRTNLDEVLSSIAAAIDYVLHRGDYAELLSAELYISAADIDIDTRADAYEMLHEISEGGTS